MEEADPADRVATLTWIATELNEDGERPNTCTELCTVEPGVCYEVTASFSEKGDDELMTAAVNVTPLGQLPLATTLIPCRAGDLEVVKIYNFHDGEAHIGVVEVGYESDDA